MRIDLGRIRQNVRAIAQTCHVPLLAVVKADAYGLGMVQVCESIADLVSAFCVFHLQEAVQSDLSRRTGQRVLVMGPPGTLDPEDYIFHGAVPAVHDIETARLLRKARPALCVDTGMQRFACPIDQFEAVLAAGGCTEVFTHATSPARAAQLHALANGRNLFKHAAASALLGDPATHLDAVRPGIAMYANAVQIRTRLHEARKGTGPAGYTEFEEPYHGVILAGYAHGLRKGPCLIGGRRSRIIEVGMQSAFVRTQASDRAGDEVVLLGDGLTAEEIARDWQASPQEVLTSLGRASTRSYHR